MSNKIFNSVPIEVQNKSGFDMSHENVFSGKVGTLVPSLVREIMPGDKISLGVMSNVTLPPMATTPIGRIQFKTAAFFVPMRLLYGGWQYFMSQNADHNSGLIPTVKTLPKVNFSYDEEDTSWDGDFGPGSLSDYLGVKISMGNAAASVYSLDLNALPYLAYHKIWQDYFRNPNIQKPAFVVQDSAGTFDNYSCACCPTNTADALSFSITSDTRHLYDGVDLTNLRQALWDNDYFTSATSKPQLGDASKLTFSVSGSTGSFTIASLRAANSLQKWLERNNLVGTDYYNIIRAQYGSTPADYCCTKAIYLGSQSLDVYSKSVMQSTDAVGASNNNPFTTTGAKYGSSQAVGDDSLIDSFTASEHGYIMCISWLAPTAIYSSGTPRYLLRFKSGDFAWPLLQNVGDQEIFQYEITDETPQGNNTTFGYQQRYADYKCAFNEVHGLLREDESLSSFVMTRYFEGTTTIGSDFVTIPQNALDNITAVTSDMSLYGYWADMYYKEHMVRPLAAYSVPTLGDEKDTHTIIVDKNGKHFS